MTERTLLAERYDLASPPAAGRVQKAWDRVTRSEVTLRFLRVEDPAERERWRREGRVLLRVHHESIMDIVDVVVEEGSPWVALSFVPEGGPTLSRALEEGGRLSVLRASRIAADVAWGLSLLHRERLAYGDLEPGRIHLRGEGADGERARIAALDRTRCQGNGLIWEGRSLPGDPRYLAPEQIDGGAPSREADLFALGCIYYEMLAGRPPAGEGSVEEVAARSLLVDAPSMVPSRFGVPGRVKRILADLLRRDPSRRPSETAVLASRIEACWALLRRLPWRR